MSNEELEFNLTPNYPRGCDRVRAWALRGGRVALLIKVEGGPVCKPVILTREEWRQLNDGVTGLFER